MVELDGYRVIDNAFSGRKGWVIMMYARRGGDEVSIEGVM